MKTTKLVLILFTLVSTSCNQTKKENKAQKIENESLVDKDYLAAVLDTIWITEQRPIRLRDSLGRIYGFESEEFQKQQDIAHRNHSINERKITEILDKHGWPSLEKIGEQGNLTICNVIQHSDNEIRRKYLPLMRQAVEEKKLAPRLLARAEDRMATEGGKLQIYGGQIKYYPETKSFDVWPIVDPQNVDKRRAEIGLEPMAEFLNNLKTPLKWDLEEQLKRTAAFELERKKTENSELL